VSSSASLVAGAEIAVVDPTTSAAHECELATRIMRSSVSIFAFGVFDFGELRGKFVNRDEGFV
jgi:hypothetical protein